jgi:ribose transport system permease protein
MPETTQAIARSQSPSVRGTPREPARARRRIPDTVGLLAFLAAEIVFFSIRSPYFLNWDNWVNILNAIAITGVLACAGTLLLVAGQFDLSVGSGVAFVGVVLATVAPDQGLAVAVPLAVAAGLGIGLLNGFLVTVVGVNALITTLGTLAIFRGLTLVIGEGQNIIVEDFAWATERPFLDIPVTALAFAALAVVFLLVMRLTVYGRKMYAIGANPVAARLVGIRVNRSLFLAFLLSGMCMAIAGLLATSQLGSTSGTTGSGLELAVVTAVILGGTSLAGGVGTIQGTIVGLLIVGVLSNGLTLLNVESPWQQVATGILLILAVAFDRLRQTVLARRA